MCIQEDSFVDQMVEAEFKTQAAQEAYDYDKQQWEVMNAKLQQHCTKLGDQYERKRLDLFVSEAKLLQAEGSTNAQLEDLRKQLAKAQ